MSIFYIILLCFLLLNIFHDNSGYFLDNCQQFCYSNFVIVQIVNKYNNSDGTNLTKNKGVVDCMRFGIKTLDEFDYRGKTVICRVDINQPVDRATGTLRSTTRIRACVPTIRELLDKGAHVVLLAHQGSDIEYKNY